MSKAYSRFLTALFCLFLGGLLVWHVLLPDRDRSEVENRTLTQLPEFSWESLKDGSYTAAVEEYFADQFPLRDEWTGLKARTEQLLGKTLFNGVFLCGDTLISRCPRRKTGRWRKTSPISSCDGKGIRTGVSGDHPLGGGGLEGQASCGSPRAGIKRSFWRRRSRRGFPPLTSIRP